MFYTYLLLYLDTVAAGCAFQLIYLQNHTHTHTHTSTTW